MSGYFALDPRPLLPEDAQGTRTLLLGALGVTPYIDRALEVLELAERGGGSDAEYRAMVIARDGTVAALALFGRIAGTNGGSRLFTAVLAPGIDAGDVGARLIGAVVSALRDDSARFILAEMPDDPAIGATLSMLRDNGFRDEARVPDFYRDGIALTFLRYDGALCE